MKKTLLLVNFYAIFCGVNAYNLTQISDNYNLSNNSITAFCQDEKGMMLIGTCDGLNFYNSRDVTIYQPDNEKNYLSGNIIDKIIYTGDNIFWVQTYYGLNRLDVRDHSVAHFHDFRKLFFMEKDRTGNLFIINESNSIYYYHHKSRSFKKILMSGVVVSDIAQFFIDSENRMQIITNQGYNLAYQINQNEKTDEITLATTQNLWQLRGKFLYCFYENDNLYVIDNDHNLHNYNVISGKIDFVCSLKKEIDKRGKISSIVRHKTDYFIGFQTSGLLLLEKQSAGNFRSREIEVNSGVFCLKKDLRQDIIWIGTDGKGVYTYTNTAFSIRSNVLGNLTHKIERPVRALFLDRENTLWVGSKGDGILKIYDYDINRSIYDSRIEPVNTSNSQISDNVVYAFAKSRKNILWVGCEEGLNCYSYRTRKMQKVKINIENQPFQYIHDIYETADGYLWLASVGQGVVRAKIGGSDDAPYLTDIKHYTVNKGDFQSNYFFSIYAENDSSLYFANRGQGAFIFNHTSDKLEAINATNSYSNHMCNEVFAIRKDINGNLLLATGYGLIKYTSQEDYQIFNSWNGFLNNSIHAILCDDGSNIFWLSTNRGMVCFNRENDTFRSYEKPDGLQITEFSDGAAFYDKNEKTLFFGGINGFVAIQKDEDEENHFTPDIFFNRLTIFGKHCNMDENMRKNRLTLDYKQNFFSLAFTAIDHIDGGNYTYYYKVAELSDKWINNGTSNVVSFSNLSAGNYTLMVKYNNRASNIESKTYQLQIRILPPFYFSRWAKTLYFLLILAIGYLALRILRKRQGEKRQILIDIMEKEHQKEVFEGKLRFFTNIAHEFCTPLTLISGPCERILAQPDISHFVSNYVKMIRSNAERLNNLILELIEFRRIETGNRELFIEEIPATKIIQNTLKQFSDMAASRNIEVNFSPQTDIMWKTDKGFFVTIVSNLVSNAFKYTPAGKKIRIELLTSTPPLDVNGELVLKIANEGQPVKENDFKRIFDRYSILDNFENQENIQTFSRNGLGLAILYNMVNLLGGTVAVSNTDDGFVEFTVTLPQRDLSPITQANPPVYMPKSEKIKLMPLPEFVFDKCKPTLLAIDDDIEMLWLVSEMFANEFNVKTTSNPQQIDSILEEMHPNIIISDMMMPNLSGAELTRKIKQQKETSHIPVILMSGNYDLEQRIEAIEAGAEMYINKPFDTKYLEISVKRIMERKENLKDYFSQPISAYEFAEGKLTHKEDKKFLQKILNIINDNITNEDLSLNFVAEKLRMGSRSLYRKMKEIGDDSLINIIKEARLQYAVGLLIKSRLTIEEVAYQAGFSNKVTFFKAFNKKYGCTPKEYRMKLEVEVGH